MSFFLNSKGIFPYYLVTQRIIITSPVIKMEWIYHPRHLEWQTPNYLSDLSFFKNFYIFKNCYTIFKGYTPFTVITKYWLYSPRCTIHPYSLSYASSYHLT